MLSPLQEAVAAKVMRVAKEGTLTNLADQFTKPLMQRVREASWTVSLIEPTSHEGRLEGTERI